MKETLNARKNGSNVICWTPSILENVQAELAICVDVRMEHSREELDSRGFIWIVFVERQRQLESPILEWCVG